jgi:hypothetical protein
MLKNHKVGLLMLITAVWFTLIACGIGLPKLPGMPSGDTSGLWSDVPMFKGATQDANEALGTTLFNQAQADQKSKMETLIFHTDKQPSDVADFYTDALMKKQGWAPNNFSNSAGCTTDTYEDQPRAICMFSKKDADGRKVELDIDARPDPKGNQIRLVFVRTVMSK